jgi:hypothetical protein
VPGVARNSGGYGEGFVRCTSDAAPENEKTPAAQRESAMAIVAVTAPLGLGYTAGPAGAGWQVIAESVGQEWQADRLQILPPL